MSGQQPYSKKHPKALEWEKRLADKIWCPGTVKNSPAKRSQSMETEGLNYFVVARRGGQWLAGFQYRQWAEEWKEKYCATGLVLTHQEWVYIQSEELQRELREESEKPQPNGGILGDIPPYIIERGDTNQ